MAHPYRYFAVARKFSGVVASTDVKFYSDQAKATDVDTWDTAGTKTSAGSAYTIPSTGIIDVYADVDSLYVAESQSGSTAYPMPRSNRVVPELAAPAPLRRLHSLFAPLACDLAVGKRPNDNDYELLYGFGGGRYWRALLALESANPGTYPLNQMQAQAEVEPMLSVEGDDASVTIAEGVTGPTAQSAAYGGEYWYGTGATHTFTITTPASTTRIGIRQPLVSNGGLARVSIDADYTLANHLPTAQDVVDSGAYPNTILVANGGPCAVTDRVLDSYSGIGTVYDNQIAIADGLTAGVHTVVLTPVAVARSVGSGTRVYFSGYGYATAATLVTTSNVVGYTTHNLNTSAGSVWEYAFRTGGTYFGNVHGYEVQDSIAVTVDGAASTPSAGQIVGVVNEADITRTSHLVNPADTGQTVANIVTVYHLDRNGLRVDATITWAASLTITAAYAMAPMNSVPWGAGGRLAQDDVCFDTGRLLAGPTTHTFTGSGSYFPTAGLKTDAAWIYGGNYGLLAWLLNPGEWTNEWAASGDFVKIEDRAAASGAPYVTKIYFGRIWAGGSSEAVVSGDVWKVSMLYLVGRFPSGAAATLGA